MKIDVAERRPDGDLFYLVLVNPDAPKEEQEYEEFSFGSDVEQADAEREMLLLLKERYLSTVPAAPPRALSSQGKQIDTNRWSIQ